MTAAEVNRRRVRERIAKTVRRRRGPAGTAGFHGRSRKSSCVPCLETGTDRRAALQWQVVLVLLSTANANRLQNQIHWRFHAFSNRFCLLLRAIEYIRTCWRAKPRGKQSNCKVDKYYLCSHMNCRDKKTKRHGKYSRKANQNTSQPHTKTRIRNRTSSGCKRAKCN